MFIFQNCFFGVRVLVPNMISIRFCVLSLLLFTSFVTSDDDNCVAELARAVSDRDALNVKLKDSENSFQTLKSENTKTEQHVLKLQDEVESLTTKLKSTEEALKASRAECDVKGYLQCKDELKVSSGAAKQLEVELGNSFARVEVLSSEIKQLKTIIEEFENKAKHTQAELDALVLSTSSSSFLQFCQKLETQFKNFGPYWRSFKESSLTALESARQHPMTQKALGVLSRFGEQGKQVFNELYLKAEPHVTAAYKTGKQYGQVAFAKTNEVYILAKPAIDRSIKTSKEITLQGAAIARTYSYQVATVLREKSVEFYESQFVADLKKQSVETVGEIEDYVRNQMDQIPALQPFAKTQYALLITYTLLSLPVLVVLTILMSFCGGPSTKSAEAKTPVPKKTKPASKKPKKSRNT